MNEWQNILRVCYFGLFDRGFSRNKIYMRGLRESGVDVIPCTDSSRGLKKFWMLFKKHKTINGDYDVMVVGYPGYIVVPFAKLVSSKKVILDAMCSMYESLILSRDAYRGNPLRIPIVKFIDWLAYKSADLILLETEQQKRYFVDRLGVPERKCAVVYTGVDEEVFFCDERAEKFPDFTVLFRGRIVKEAGTVTIVKAAKLLEHEGVRFLIIGYGWDDAMDDFDRAMEELDPKNVIHIRKQIPEEDLRGYMAKCHISLGQFGVHERLERTIPHKAFESLAMRLPYVTARAEGVRDILRDGENCLMVDPSDAESLAKAILKLKDDKELRDKLSKNGYQSYEQVFTTRKLGEKLRDILESLCSKEY